jgi:integrase
VSKARKTIAKFGEHGRMVRVFIERGGLLVRAQWREGERGAKRLRTESWPNTAEKRLEAKEFARGVSDTLAAGRAPARGMTVREMWERYTAAEFPALRPRTRALNADAWRKWELVVGKDAVAEDLGPDSMALLRSELERQGLAVRTIGRVIRGVKVVYNWSEAHELIERNRVHRYRYKVAKDRRPTKVAEYRQEDFIALCAALPVEGTARTWRPGGVVRVCGYQGIRQNAVRHLAKADIDFDGNRLHWRPEYDKLGRDWWQPMRAATRTTLEAVLRQHARIGYDGPWVFPKPREGGADPVYSAQSLWWAMQEAEKRAGIAHIERRGAHGLRRLLAGDVFALTGNLKTAGDAIGDTDLKVLADAYLVTREDEVRSAFQRLDEGGNDGR